MNDAITACNGTTCHECGKPLLKEDATAYITQTQPHFFFFICDACEKAKAERV